MYELFLFYWLVWIIVIIIGFFMKHSKMRSLLFMWTLCILFISETSILLGSIHVSLAFIIFVIGAIILFVQQSFTMYKIAVTFSVMIGYVALLMWEQISPIWFFMPTYFITPIITVCLITVLVKSFYSQIAIALVSSSFGQVVFELILISYQLNHIIGEKLTFIHCGLTILILIVLRFVHSTIFTVQMAQKRKII